MLRRIVSIYLMKGIKMLKNLVYVAVSLGLLCLTLTATSSELGRPGTPTGIITALDVEVAKENIYNPPENQVVYVAEGTQEKPNQSLRSRSSLSVGMGCLRYGPGNYECQAWASGGSGSYNYWWMYTGDGQLYQTNSAIATVTGCAGTGTLTVQVLDRTTGETSQSAAFQLFCEDCGPNGDCESDC